MRGPLIRALPFLLSLLAAEPATADVAIHHLDVELGSDEARFEIQFDYVGADSTHFRSRVDSSGGDGDGTVNETEVHAFESGYTSNATSTDATCLGEFDWLRLSGRAPQRFEARWALVANATGIVVSSSQVSITVGLTLGFPAPAAGNVSGFVDLGQLFEATMVSSCDLMPPPPPQNAALREQTHAAATYRIGPRPGENLSRESVLPVSARALWDETGLVADDEAERGILNGNAVTLDVQTFATPPAEAPPSPQDAGVPDTEGQPPAPPTAGGNGAVWYAAFPAVALVGLAAWRWQAIAWTGVRLVAVGGFSRLEKDEILDHPRRELLYALVRASPGRSLTELKRDSGMAQGVLLHHLAILSQKGLVNSTRDGARVRFYTPGNKPHADQFLTPTQQRLLAAVEAEPGATQSDFVERLGVPRDVASYNLLRLEQRGLLRSVPAGKWRKYYPTRDNA